MISQYCVIRTVYVGQTSVHPLCVLPAVGVVDYDGHHVVCLRPHLGVAHL